MRMFKTVMLVLVALIGLLLGLVSAVLVNAAPVNSGVAWMFAVSCITGTWMFIGAMLLIVNRQ